MLGDGHVGLLAPIQRPSCSLPPTLSCPNAPFVIPLPLQVLSTHRPIPVPSCPGLPVSPLPPSPTHSRRRDRPAAAVAARPGGGRGAACAAHPRPAHCPPRREGRQHPPLRGPPLPPNGILSLLWLLLGRGRSWIAFDHFWQYLPWPANLATSGCWWPLSATFWLFLAISGCFWLPLSFSVTFA